MPVFLDIPTLDLEKANKPVKYLRRYRKGGRYVYVYADKKGGVDKRKLFAKSDGGSFQGLAAGDRFASPTGGFLTIKSINLRGDMTYIDSDGKEHETNDYDFGKMIERFHQGAINSMVAEGMRKRDLILYEARKIGNEKLIARASKLVREWEKKMLSYEQREERDEAKRKARQEEWERELAEKSLTSEEKERFAKTSDAIVSILKKPASEQEESLAAIKKEVLKDGAVEAYIKNKSARRTQESLMTDYSDDSDLSAITLALVETFQKAQAPTVTKEEFNAAFPAGDTVLAKFRQENPRFVVQHSRNFWQTLKYSFKENPEGLDWCESNSELASAGLPPVSLATWQKGKKKDKAASAKIKTREDAMKVYEELGIDLSSETADEVAINVAKTLQIARSSGERVSLSFKQNLSVVVRGGYLDADEDTVLRGFFQPAFFKMTLAEKTMTAWAHEMWHARDFIMGGGIELATSKNEKSLGAKELAAFTMLLRSLPSFRESIGGYEKRDTEEEKYAAYLSSSEELFARFGEQLTAYRRAQATAKGKTASIGGVAEKNSHYDGGKYVAAKDFPRIVAVWESLAVSKIFEETIAKAL